MVTVKKNLDLKDVHVNPHVDVNVNPHVDVHVNPHVDVHVKHHVDVHVKPRVDVHVKPRVDVRVNPRVNPRVDVRVKPRVDVRVKQDLDGVIVPIIYVLIILTQIITLVIDIQINKYVKIIEIQTIKNEIFDVILTKTNVLTRVQNFLKMLKKINT
jgi:hypothetical protein